MRIVLVDASLFSWPYDRALAKALSSLGHTVTVIGPQHHREYIDPDLDYYGLYYSGMGASILQPASRRIKRLLKGICHIRDSVTIHKSIMCFQPDIVHFQWLPLPVADQIVFNRIQKNCPVVVTLHNSQPFNGDRGSVMQSYGHERLVSRADAIIVHTEQALARAKKFGVPVERIATIPHGILFEPEVRVFREGKTLQLLFFGKIRPYKGLDILIESLSYISDVARRQLHIRVVGEPFIDVRPFVERASTSGWNHEGISFEFSFVNEDEIRVMLREADALLMPYREVDASGVLSLAIAFGVPVIGSDIPGISQLLVDGRECLLVPRDDARALAAAIERFVGDANLRSFLRAGIASKLQEIPGWDVIAEKTTECYEATLQCTK